MQKINIFLLLFAFSLGSLIIIYAIDAHITASSPTHQGLLQDMWSHMSGMPSSTQSYLWIIPLVLISIIIISIVGLVYFTVFTAIKRRTKIENREKSNITQGLPLTPFDSAMKTLTPEERRVIEVLVAHEGKYLQKYISKETGLSRLKTHRIVARLAEREIVTVRKIGNTNEVMLVDWLKDRT